MEMVLASMADTNDTPMHFAHAAHRCASFYKGVVVQYPELSNSILAAVREGGLDGRANCPCVPRNAKQRVVHSVARSVDRPLCCEDIFMLQGKGCACLNELVLDRLGEPMTSS